MLSTAGDIVVVFSARKHGSFISAQRSLTCIVAKWGKGTGYAEHSDASVITTVVMSDTSARCICTHSLLSKAKTASLLIFQSHSTLYNLCCGKASLINLRIDRIYVHAKQTGVEV